MAGHGIGHGGPLTYQPKNAFLFLPIKVRASPYDFPTRGGLQYGFCSFRLPDPALYMKQFGSVFPDGFLQNFTEVRSVFETFFTQRICSYVEELKSLDKDRAQRKSSKKDSNKKNDPVTRRIK